MMPFCIEAVISQFAWLSNILLIYKPICVLSSDLKSRVLRLPLRLLEVPFPSGTLTALYILLAVTSTESVSSPRSSSE